MRLCDWPRNVCRGLRYVVGQYPRSNNAGLRLEDEYDPVTALSIIEAEPAACLSTFALTASLDAYPHESAGFNREVVAFPVVGHLGRILSCEAELTQGVVLPSITEKL